MINRITKIEKQKKNSNRLSIYINEEFFCGISLNVYNKFELEKGKKISDDLLKEVLLEENFSKCYNKALSLLTYKSRTKNELKEKLQKKDYSIYIIDRVLKKLEESNFIDDYEYSINYIEIKKDKYGPRRISYDLKRKGISEEIIEKISSKFSFSQQYEVSYKLANKKNKNYKNISYKKRYQRLSGFLNRKGFDYSVIKSVIKELLEDYKKDRDYY